MSSFSFPPASGATTIAGMSKLVTMTEAARLLNLAPRSVRRLAQVGVLDRRRRGRRSYVTVESLTRLQDARALAPHNSPEELAVRLLSMESRIEVLERGRWGRQSLLLPALVPKARPLIPEDADIDTIEDFALIAGG
jgi:hypothetical protein